MDWGILIQLAAVVASGIGTYAAIRSDLAEMRARLGGLTENHRDLRDDVKALAVKVDAHIESRDLHVYHQRREEK